MTNVVMMAARGACYGEGCHNKSICSYSAAGGPTTFKSGVCDVDRNRAQLVLTRFGQVTGGGAYARAHVSTPFLYLKNGSADYVQIWRVDTNSFAKYKFVAHFLFGEKETHRK